MLERLKKILQEKFPSMTFSSRETTLITVIGLGFALYIIFTFIISPTSEAFAKQYERLKSIQQTLEVAPDMVQRYSKLLARRSEIEKFYERIEAKESALSHLESLLLNVGKVQPGTYTVNQRPQPDFADKYKHTAFIVKFDIGNLENLASLLKDIAQGSQPMLLSQISLEKKMSADILSVQLEVSAFERINK